ncbi:hypothetical protein, partial [Thiolapillus sp.]|uniref:hypothetical protein n=1 Tax=Thiolapillus sp. TaxID=2017437 RepID=UPI003AF8B56A
AHFSSFLSWNRCSYALQSSTVKESGKMSSFAFFVHFFPVLLDKKTAHPLLPRGPRLYFSGKSAQNCCLSSLPRSK